MAVEAIPATVTLAEYLTANLGRPFVWGEHDCARFAANWVRLATGKDYLVDVPPWASQREAARVLKALGGMQAIVDSKLDRIEPNLACDGDLALFEKALCIYSGHHVVGPGAEGLTFVPRLKAVCAWRCA